VEFDGRFFRPSLYLFKMSLCVNKELDLGEFSAFDFPRHDKNLANKVAAELLENPVL